MTRPAGIRRAWITAAVVGGLVGALVATPSWAADGATDDSALTEAVTVAAAKIANSTEAAPADPAGTDPAGTTMQDSTNGATPAESGAPTASEDASDLVVSVAPDAAPETAPAARAASTSVAVSGLTFDWGINNESNGGAYFGGCNFLSAGIAGDTRTSRVWSRNDGFYAAQAGNTTIVRPTADGTELAQPAWDTRCTTPAGTSVAGKTTNAPDSYTQTRVQISGGSGTADSVADSADISWTGSFTVVYYGGMTYWSATDPHLTVTNGTGSVTATLSGYAADMDDSEIWRPLAPRTVTLATLEHVDVTDSGIAVTPTYLGVSIPADVAGRNAQAPRTAANESWWGAFPADFLRFQMETGQSSYWFTTAGESTSIQPRKTTLPLRVTGDVPSPEPERTAPTIVEQPKSVDVQVGETATFTVGPAGSPTPTIQWQHLTSRGVWEDLAGKTGATLTLTATSDVNGTKVRAIARNDLGTATSNEATLSVVTAGGGGDTGGETPTGPVTATGALFDWGINNESNGGAYFGGCNFLSAGVAGNTGMPRQWSAADGFYRTQDGNTTIVRPIASGSTQLAQPAFADRCKNPSGGRLSTTNASDSYSQTRVRIAGGVGTLDPATNTGEISWNGSFTVAYYGGMTYWSASNPRLVVHADGTGTVTVTASGYGADMDDESIWRQLPPRDVVIANLSGVRITPTGFSITPDYLGVSVPSDVAGRNAQAPRTAENESWWGAFPADFLRFQVETGQSSYWFTTPGSSATIQPRKVPLPLTVCTTADCTVPTQADNGGPAAFDLRQNSRKPPAVIARAAAQAPPVVAAALEETVVLMRSAAVPQATTAAAADQRPVVIAITTLILALGLLTLVTAAGGTLFATGILGRGQP